MLRMCSFRWWIVWARLALTYRVPFVLLHLWHAGRRFSSEWSPPRSSSMMWSAVVAGAGQYEQVGLSASNRLRLRWYSMLAYGLVIA